MDKKILIITTVLLIAAIAGIIFMQKPKTAADNPLLPPPINPDVKIEINCVDSIDNDEDGMTDNEDGDCWIKEGAIYETHPYYYPNHSFKEITNDIPRIADLGVKTIYLMPVWKHEPLPSEGSKYRYGFIYHILDYFSVSPEFGTEQELKEVVKTAHRHGMKVIFDL